MHAHIMTNVQQEGITLHPWKHLVTGLKWITEHHYRKGDCTDQVDVLWLCKALLHFCLSVRGCCRCSESAVTATSLPYPPCPSPSASRLAATSPDGQCPAPLPVVRQALERALLQNNDDFWKKLPRIKREDMSKQCPKRRGVQAMQLFLRLHILVACKGTSLVNSCLPAVVACAMQSSWVASWECCAIVSHLAIIQTVRNR